MEKDSSKFTNAFNRFEEWRNNVCKTASGKIGEELNLGSDTKKDATIDIEKLNIYIQNNHILKDISLQLHDKKITCIIGPSGCGKTTLLRDLVRQISDGWETFPGNTVGVVDERSEIGGSYQGIPQNDVGIRTDVLDCCSKAEGMVMLLRSMAPQVIAVDEIGNYEDIRAIEMTLNSGCKLLATVHGSSIDEIRKKPLLERLIKEHVFERYIILQKETAGKIGKVREIYDERGTCLYQRQRSVC